jgi:hypothetical protein
VSLVQLVGTWRTEARFPNGVSGTGTTTFELVLGGEYLLQHATVEVDGPPEGLMVIGPGEHGALTQHYFDSRGVIRIYAMTFEDGVWTLVRNSPDFSDLSFWQRYTGTFSADGDTIDGAWEISHDEGATWEHDFDLVYRRTA